MPSNKPQLTIHLDPELLERVESWRARRGWSKNQAVNELIRRGFEHTTTTTESSPQ